MKSPHLSFIVGSAIMTLLLFAGCKKEETKTDSTIPVLAATKVVTDITQTSATSGGNVTSDGGSAVTSRGVCYGKNSNPTIDFDLKTENGTGAGEFGSSLTGLEAGTKYFVRAYATNSKGTGYGNEVSFTTQAVAANVPVLTTGSIFAITSTSATSGGNVTSDGGSAVTARGVVWSTSQNPTIALSTKTNIGTGTGIFTSSITGFSPGTLYYVRAYATNSVGTGYGAELTFTSSLFTVGGGVTDIDGNAYNTIVIGGQEWMKENLKVSKYRNGDPIPTNLSDAAWGAATTGAYAIYKNDAANNTTYGKLYNWYAVADSRNLCPVGWHVPSDTEWKTLEISLGMSATDADLTGVRGSNQNVGGKLKSTSSLWTFPNLEATNKSGFSGLPGGIRSWFGTYDYIGEYGDWWSSTENSTPYAWYRSLKSNNGHSYRVANYEQSGFSVRCLRD